MLSRLDRDAIIKLIVDYIPVTRLNQPQREINSRWEASAQESIGFTFSKPIKCPCSVCDANGTLKVGLCA